MFSLLARWLACLPATTCGYTTGRRPRKLTKNSSTRSIIQLKTTTKTGDAFSFLPPPNAAPFVFCTTNPRQNLDYCICGAGPARSRRFGSNHFLHALRRRQPSPEAHRRRCPLPEGRQAVFGSPERPRALHQLRRLGGDYSCLLGACDFGQVSFFFGVYLGFGEAT